MDGKGGGIGRGRLMSLLIRPGTGQRGRASVSASHSGTPCSQAQLTPGRPSSHPQVHPDARACIMIPGPLFGPGYNKRVTFWDLLLPAWLEGTFEDFPASFLHVDDAAEAYVGAVKQGQSGGRYMLAGESMLTSEYFKVEHCSFDSLSFTVVGSKQAAEPTRCLQMQVYAACAGLEVTPTASVYKGRRVEYDDSGTRRALGWEPYRTVHQSMPQLVSHLRMLGKLPGGTRTPRGGNNSPGTQRERGMGAAQEGGKRPGVPRQDSSGGRASGASAASGGSVGGSGCEEQLASRLGHVRLQSVEDVPGTGGGDGGAGGGEGGVGGDKGGVGGGEVCRGFDGGDAVPAVEEARDAALVAAGGA